MEFISVKNLVTRTKSNAWFGIDYNMNIYKGCCHGCIYCDSRSECYGVINFDDVKIKKNAIQIIEAELKGKRKKGVIGTGAMSDPYNPFEKEYKLTREGLKLIDRYRFGVSIDTKSDLIIRDIDILQEIKKHSPVIAKITITSSSDEFCKKVEPNVSLSSKRFSAINELSRNDIVSGVLMTPVLPFLEDTEENIVRIVDLAAESGAKFIYAQFGVTLRSNQRNWYYKKLDEKFPNLKEKYIKQFGDRYMCDSPKSKELWQIFKNKCREYNIIYRMQDIIDLYRKDYESSQITFF